MQKDQPFRKTAEELAFFYIKEAADYLLPCSQIFDDTETVTFFLRKVLSGLDQRR
jgi:hypothetical protein